MVLFCALVDGTAVGIEVGGDGTLLGTADGTPLGIEVGKDDGVQKSQPAQFLYPHVVS